MKEKHFIWITETSWPRRGAKLIRGAEYEAKDFPDHVVEEWIKSGAAMYSEEAESTPIPKKKIKNEKAE